MIELRLLFEAFGVLGFIIATRLTLAVFLR